MKTLNQREHITFFRQVVWTRLAQQHAENYPSAEAETARTEEEQLLDALIHFICEDEPQLHPSNTMPSTPEISTLTQTPSQP